MLISVRAACCVAALFTLMVFVPAGSAEAAATQRAPSVGQLGDLVIQVHRCHRRVRGNRRPHVHRGRNCRRVNVRRRATRGHCHRNARRHGTRLHRHVGRNCVRRNLRRYDRPVRRGCIRVGPVYFCD